MTFPKNRPPVRDQRAGMSWGLPLGIAVVAVLLGLFFLTPRDSTTTATNNPPVTTTTPIPAPTTPAPAPSRPSGG